jgi:hypothetical protein
VRIVEADYSGVSYAIENLSISNGFSNSKLGTIQIYSTISCCAGASLSVNGTLNNLGSIDSVGFGGNAIFGTLVNDGQINVNDILGVGGSYQQRHFATLNITSGSSGYPVLNVTGSATLDGNLNATLANGFSPCAGDVLQILSATPVNGGFSSVAIPSGESLFADATGLAIYVSQPQC